MRKFLTLALPALVALIGATACDPDDQGAQRPASVTYEAPPTTAGDPDGPAVDRDGVDAPTGRTLPQFPPSGRSAAAHGTSDDATMTASEAARFGSWDGTGDVPYGDDPDNDGRFSDIACDTFDDQGVTCRYDDGTVAARDIHYSGDEWYWGTTPISDVGQCPAEDTSCSIVWDHSTTSPVAVAR